MNRKQIIVTAEDIAKGERHSYCECPIARAVKRAFRTKRTRKPVHVRHEGIFVGVLDEERFWAAPISPEVGEFIECFDRGDVVEPFAFIAEFE